MRSIKYNAASILVTSLILTPVRGFSQESRSTTLFTTEHSLDLERISDPQISPDGKQIIYTRRWVNQLEDKWETALWIVDASGAHNRFLAKGSNPRWSSDGARIAYLADGDPKGTQIFVRWVGIDGPASQITTVTESPADIRWSPDGKWIGFSMFVPKAPEWRIDMPKSPTGAKWTGAPRIVQQLHFRQDQRGFMEPGYRHMFVVTSEGGTPKQLTSGDWSVGARFDGLDGNVGWSWTPDGRSIVVEGMSDSSADLNYRNANLYVVDATNVGMRRLTTQDGVWTGPAISPNGKSVAFAGYPASKASYHAAEIYVMPLEGGAMKKISGTQDRDVGSLIWASDGTGVFYSADDHGTSNVYFAGANGNVRQVTNGVHTLSLNSISRSGVGTGLEARYDRPNDVARIDLMKTGGPSVRLTAANDDVLERLQLGQVEKITYRSTGGAVIDGWIVKPPSFDPSKKYPLIMEIHGGPHGAYTVAFNPQFQNFAANGFVVLYTNPRGSTGYGSAIG